MVGWHHWLNGYEFEKALVVGEGQGSLACCSPYGHKKSDMTEQLNRTELTRGMGFPGSWAGKKSACNAGTPSLMPGSRRSPLEGIGYPLQFSWASLVVQTVKNLPTMWETWVQSLGWEDPLEEGMSTLSSILAWRIPWTEESGGLQSMGSQRVGHNWATKHSLAQGEPGFMEEIREGN